MYCLLLVVSNRPLAASNYVVGWRHAKKQTSQRRLINKESEKGEA